MTSLIWERRTKNRYLIYIDESICIPRSAVLFVASISSTYIFVVPRAHSPLSILPGSRFLSVANCKLKAIKD
jgi:hypothetical protein